MATSWKSSARHMPDSGCFCHGTFQMKHSHCHQQWKFQVTYLHGKGSSRGASFLFFPLSVPFLFLFLLYFYSISICFLFLFFLYVCLVLFHSFYYPFLSFFLSFFLYSCSLSAVACFEEQSSCQRPFTWHHSAFIVHHPPSPPLPRLVHKGTQGLNAGALSNITFRRHV